MLHCFPTDIAVSTLSPVAIIVLMLALLRVSMDSVVAAFSLFYIIKKPKNTMFDST